MPILLAFALAAAGGSGPSAAGAQGLDQPGDVHLIRPEELPPPFQTSSANNPPQLVARPAGAELRLPAGFHADLFYDGTLGGNNSPRTMALAPNGDVFVVNSGGSTLYVLRDADGDGKAEGFFTFATKTDGLNLPFGIAFHDRFLYVGNTNQVVRFPYEPGQTKGDGGMFPPEYQNDAFVALHGSWNRSQRTGYKIVRVRFQDGKPVGGYEDFLTGWLLGAGNRNVWGRPVGLLVARDGSLLITDDGAHRIWRVAYSQP
jgi:glucose/arabinose dehydrogenase